jgi:transcriptional regulator with XRE-family HTH domain
MPALSNIDSFAMQGVVQEPAIESLIEAKDLGRRLKRLRLKRSMGLVELGQLAGLSASYLSQLETGRVVPTLRNLSLIALVHKVDLSYFFNDPKANSFRASRGKDRIRIPLGAKENPFMLSESMSALIPDRKFVPCIAELRPGIEDALFDAHLFEGVEFAYVMQGLVKVTTTETTEVLEQDDLLWVEGNARRQYQCAGTVPARVLIISFPHQW